MNNIKISSSTSTPTAASTMNAGDVLIFPLNGSTTAIYRDSTLTNITVPIGTNIVQSTGTNTIAVMSQNATTSALNLKANTADLSAVAFSGSYNDLIDQPAVPSPVTVVQTTGTSTTSVMSQNAVSVALGNKLDNSSVVQTLGTSTTSVMSQNVVSSTLNGKQANIAAGTLYNVIAYNGTAGTVNTVTRQTTIRATATAVDTAYPTEKAVATALSSKQSNIPAGTSGQVVTYSGTAGTFGTARNVDTTVTSASANLITSGAVFTSLPTVFVQLTQPASAKNGDFWVTA